MVFDSFFSEEERYLEKENTFVDREELIQAFGDALESIREKERSVLIYHGVPGIGKTSLRKELPKVIIEYNKLHKKSQIIWVTVDFETEEFRHPNKFLEILKNQFQDKYDDLKFYTFDFAYALYWRKTNPRVPLCKENYSDDGIDAYLSDIIDNFSDICGIFNPIKIPRNIEKIIKKLPEIYNKWALENKEEISRLVSMEPAEIEKQLYRCWAYDLNNYLQKTSKAAVIFIDSYEALWGKDRSLANLSSKDQWIRKLIQSLFSSSCLWVLCGQESPLWKNYSDKEKTLWENSIELYEIRDLPEKDARYLLKYYGILESEIQDAIIEGSEGVPYYLDLSINTYKYIKKIGEPKPSDFAKVPTEIFDRFIKYLDEGKESVIKVLSVPRFWNLDIFNVLVKEFTNYPPNEISRIHSFSFIHETEKWKWSMHQLMRKSWEEYQNWEERKNVHIFMLNYYNQKLEDISIKNITEEQKTFLIEGFYHAKMTLEISELLNWLITSSKPFEKAAFRHLLLPLYEEMLQMQEKKLSLEHPDMAITLHKMATLYKKMGEYKESLRLYQNALEIYKKVENPDNLEIASIMNGMGWLYFEMGEYEKSLPLYQQALEIRTQILGLEHSIIAKNLDNQAVLFHNMGKYKEALSLYQQALEIREKLLGPENLAVAVNLNNISTFYRRTGDYKKALSLCQRALEIKQKTLQPSHPSIAVTLAVQADIYKHMGAYDQALLLCTQALEIKERTREISPQSTAITLRNLAEIYKCIGKYDEALILCETVLQIQEKNLEPSHPSMIITLNVLAEIYQHDGNYEKALNLIYHALEICEKKLNPEHPNVARTYNCLAEIYKDMEEFEKALPLCQRAFDIREKMLGSEHPDVAESLNNLAGLYYYLGKYENSIQLYKRALEIVKNSFGTDYPKYGIIKNNLEDLQRKILKE